jgi:hypothetical protein
MSADERQILSELRAIRNELSYIKVTMVDKDMLLTDEEKKLLDQSHKNEKQRRLVSSQELQKKLKI